MTPALAVLAAAMLVLGAAVLLVVFAFDKLAEGGR